MEQIAGWIAPVATMGAAMMTAANLGARITGWGFVVFTVGSIAWSTVAVATGQQNLLWTNAFLTLVNGVGVWRWLGRQARYEAGGATATKRSAAARVPDLFAVGSLSGAKVTGRDGQVLGTIVEGMMRCSGAALAYVVVSEGGVGGVGERLHAVPPTALRFSDDGVTSDLSVEALQDLPVLEQEHWPMRVA
jgi:hypothetical protein